MRRMRGFKIGKRLIGVSKWIFRRARKPSRYSRLSPSESACKPKAIAKLINWGRCLTTGAKSFCSSKTSSGYITVGKDPVREKPVTVPKGHLAVYVGQDGDFHRVLVPVIYFNHPLFGELLREAEEEYGFNQQGGIRIPCRLSDFERVQAPIKAGRYGGARTKLTLKRNHR